MTTPAAPLPLKRSARVGSLCFASLATLLLGCAALDPWLPAPAPKQPAPAPIAKQIDAKQIDTAAEERSRERVASLEREIERLRADLEQAEATMLATDSDGRAGGNRAAAASLLAEALISVDRAAKVAPWQRAAIDTARLKLDEAERQLQSGRSPAAVYFASRGQRIADTLIAEAKLVEDSPNTRFVRVERLNLRAGPSTRDSVVDVLESGEPVFEQRAQGNWKRVLTLRGEIGWVHASLLVDSRSGGGDS